MWLCPSLCLKNNLVVGPSVFPGAMGTTNESVLYTGTPHTERILEHQTIKDHPK